MGDLTTSRSNYDLTLTTADGLVIGLLLAPPVKNNKELDHETAGALTPVDATETFRPGGVPREWRDFSGGGGYSYEDPAAPNTYAWAKNMWTLIPGAALPSGELTEVELPLPSGSATMGEIAAGIEISSRLFVSAGQVALQLFPASNPTEVVNFTSLTGNANYRATSVTEYLGKAYWGAYNAGLSTAAQMCQQTIVSGVSTFTASTDAFRWQLASFFGVDGNGDWDQWLIASVDGAAAWKITNSSAPMTDANWTPGSATGTSFGNSDFQVQRIVVGDMQPFFLTRGGVYVVQRAGVYTPCITPGWLDQYSIYNGLAGMVVGSRLFASFSGSIDMIPTDGGGRPNVPVLVGPGIDTPNKTPVRGICYSMCQDGEWIVAAFYDSVQETSYICWGKPSLGRAPTVMIWHTAPIVIEGERVTWVHKSAPNGIPRLWIATRNAAETATHLYWMPLPSSGNVLQDLAVAGSWRSRTDVCTLYLSNTTWPQGIHAEKALRAVATVTEDASNTSYLNVYASADGAAREKIGATVIESPYAEARILADVSGREIAPSVDFKAGDGSEPPVLRGLTVWAAEGVRATSTIEVTLRFAKNMLLRDRKTRDTRDPEVIWNEFIAAQGPRPCSLENWRGTSYAVAYEQGAVFVEREIRTERKWQIDARVRFTVLARDARYGDGSLYAAAEYAAS